MGTQTATTVAPINIHAPITAPHILLSSPVSTPSSPVPPPPSPASIANAGPALARRAVFDLHASSPLSPSAGEKTLLKAQLERAKNNRVLLRNGKKARPLSQKELRRLAAEEAGADTSPGGATVAEGSAGSHTPLSLSDSDGRSSVVGLVDSIGGLLSGEERCPAQSVMPAYLAQDREAISPAPFVEQETSNPSSTASSLRSPSASPPRRAPSRRPPFVTRISRTAPTTPSISPTSHMSSLLSRRPSVKVELSTAFATGTPIRSAGSLERLSYSASTPTNKQGAGKGWATPSRAASSGGSSLPFGSVPPRRTSTPGSPLLGPLTFPPTSASGSTSPTLLARRRRHVSAGNSPVSPPKQSVMASDPRDLTLQFTRRKRAEFGPRTGSSSLISATMAGSASSATGYGRKATCAGEELCDSTEPEETDSEEEEGRRGVPYFEPSIFASPPALTPTASLTSTTSVSPLNEHGRSSSLGYWSIHSSVSSTHARSSTVSIIASSEAEETLRVLPGPTAAAAKVATQGIADPCRPVLPALQTSHPAAGTTSVPSGLAKAVPLSPSVPLGTQALPPVLPPLLPPAALPSRPSQLSLAHPAFALDRPRAGDPPTRAHEAPLAGGRPAEGCGAGLDLQRLRREQLARRRRVVEFELESGGDESSSETKAGSELPLPLRRGMRALANGEEGASESVWEDAEERSVSKARGEEKAEKAGPQNGGGVEGRRPLGGGGVGDRAPMLARRSSGKRGTARI
ncbi:hypothetical protein JCM10908_006243 [Rhodotorula pacifica]|uniref:uncharacterized protein n=1 Tax=Rhodotorula pacifica TaxID=1495444 RepID=UPI0031715AC1